MKYDSIQFDSVKKINQVFHYILNTRPQLRKRALFSDGTGDYVSPAEPKEYDTVTIRFRTAIDNVDIVLFCHDGKKELMTRADRDHEFDYYEISVRLGEEKFRYYFEVYSGQLHCFYDRVGVAKEKRPQYMFEIIPGFSTPNWAKGAVMYQIFTDRFYNGDPSNDVLDGEYYYINRQTHEVHNWERPPRDFDVADFYGGDLAGVIEKLDYLQTLGVEAIYFNPLFVSASSHKYDIQDYEHIDPHFGVILEDEGELLAPGEKDNTKASRFQTRVTSEKNLEASNALFEKLVYEAHRRGIKVIMDGVFNHCGSFNCWLDREGIYRGREGFPEGAFHSKESPYHDYFSFKNEDAFPENDTYDGWWGHDTLPKLNYEGSKELEDRIIEIGKKWVSEPYCIDGWRLDVAADLGHSAEYNHRFWRRFRDEIKAVNPNALILAEHYGDPKEWLQGDQWDSVMNYDAFMEPVSWFLTGMEKHSGDYQAFRLGNLQNFKDTMLHYSANFSTPSLQCAMNQLSNHDHSRFLTRTNHKTGRAVTLGTESAEQDVNRGVMKEAVVIQMTWPGAPTVYYGDEAGLCGYTDPDNRRAYPWGHEDRELLRFHREMIELHRSSAALRKGSLKFLDGEDSLLTYGRFNREEQFVVIVNNDTYMRSVELEVWPAGIPREAKLTQVMYTTEESHSVLPVIYHVKNGILSLSMPKHSSIVLRHQNCGEAENE